MKIFEKGSRKESFFSCYWVRLFSFGKDENERALFAYEYNKDQINTFCIMAQVGGDFFAELTFMAFKRSLTFTIWSV